MRIEDVKPGQPARVNYWFQNPVDVIIVSEHARDSEFITVEEDHPVYGKYQFDAWVKHVELR